MCNVYKTAFHDRPSKNLLLDAIIRFSRRRQVDIVLLGSGEMLAYIYIHTHF